MSDPRRHRNSVVLSKAIKSRSPVATIAFAPSSRNLIHNSITHENLSAEQDDALYDEFLHYDEYQDHDNSGHSIGLLDVVTFIEELAAQYGIDIDHTPPQLLQGLESDIFHDIQQRFAEGEQAALSDYTQFIIARLRRIGARQANLSPKNNEPAAPPVTESPLSPDSAQGSPGGGPLPPPPVPFGTPSQVAASRANQAQEYLDIAQQLDAKGNAQSAAAQAWRQKAQMARDMAAQAHNQNVDAFNDALNAEKEAYKEFKDLEKGYNQSNTSKQDFQKAKQKWKDAKAKREKAGKEYEKSKKELDKLDKNLKEDKKNQDAKKQKKPEDKKETKKPNKNTAGGGAKQQNALAGGGGSPAQALSLGTDYGGPIGGGLAGPPGLTGFLPGGMGPAPLGLLPGQGMSDDDCVKIIRDCAKKLKAGALPGSGLAILAGLAEALAAASGPCQPCPPCGEKKKNKDGDDVKENKKGDGTDKNAKSTDDSEDNEGKQPDPEKPADTGKKPPPKGGKGGGGGAVPQNKRQPQPINDPTGSGKKRGGGQPPAPKRSPSGGGGGKQPPDRQSDAKPTGDKKSPTTDPTKRRNKGTGPKETFKLRDPRGEAIGKKDEKMDYQRRLALESFIREQNLPYSIPKDLDLSDEKTFDEQRLKLRRLHIKSMARYRGLKLFELKDKVDLLDDATYEHYKKLVVDMGHTRNRMESRQQAERAFKQTDPAKRLEMALSQAIDSDKIAAHMKSQLRGLLTKQSIAMMLGMLAALKFITVLSAGSAAPVIAATLIALFGPALMPFLMGLYHTQTAETIDAFQMGVDEITRAIAALGTTALTALLFKGGAKVLSSRGGGSAPATTPTQPVPKINGALPINPPRGATVRLPGRSSTPAGGRLTGTASRVFRAKPVNRLPAGRPQPAVAPAKPAPVKPIEVGPTKPGGGGLAVAVKAAKKTGTVSKPQSGHTAKVSSRPRASRGGGSGSHNWMRAALLEWLKKNWYIGGAGGGSIWPPFDPPAIKGKTRGKFRDRDNPDDDGVEVGSTQSIRNNKAITEEQARVDSLRQALEKEGFTKGELDGVDTALRHAEGAAVHRLRTTDVKNGLLDINNNYICMHCLGYLRYLIPKGKTLTVRFKTASGKEINIRFGRGSDPQILVGKDWKTLSSRNVTMKDLEAIFKGL